MKKRAPTPAWLRWLLLAAFASCLNPKPDEEPMARPDLIAPGSKDAPSGNTGANDGPPLLIGDEDDGYAPSDPGENGLTGNIADAGVPSGDAGTTGSDAGPL
jgi:hypothetical protein